MEDMVYLIAGYAVFIISLLGFGYSLYYRHRHQQQDLEVLEQLGQPDL